MTSDASPGSNRRIDAVAYAAAIGVTVLMTALLARVVQLQLVPGTKLEAYLTPKVSTRRELPARGDLVDRRNRQLAVTRFAQRVVVDPTLFPNPPDEAIGRLATAMGISPDAVGERVMWSFRKNVERGWSPADPPGAAASKPKLPSAIESFLHMVTPSKSARPSPATEGVIIAEGEDPEVQLTRGFIRYLPVGGVLDDSAAAAVRGMKIAGVQLEACAVREYPGGGEVAALVGKVGFENKGLMGMEQRLDAKLLGTAGKVSYVRDALGTPLWVEPGQVRPATPGQDVRLSIDLELQRIGYEELLRGVEDANANGGRLVILDPATGEILAMADVVRPVAGAVEYPWVPVSVKGTGHEAPEPSPAPGGKRFITIHEDPARLAHPALARNRCIEDIYEPGSTFKPFVWSTITELGLAKVDDVFDTEGGHFKTYYGRYIEDVTKRAEMTWREVLINSSNIGMIKAAERLTYAQLHDTIVRFGFGKPTGILRLTSEQGLGGEASGIVTPLKTWTKYTHTSVAYGHEVAVTPVQMVRGFSAFARTGRLAGTLPSLRLTARSSDEGADAVVYRVLPAEIAELTRRTMRGVAENMEKSLADKHAAGSTGETGWKYPMFGKSGTAEIPLGKPPKGFRRPRGSSGYYDGQYNSSFIAGGPVEDPRLVVLVVIDDPGPEKVRGKVHYGSKVAGPVVRRVMERGLTYLGTPVPPPDPALEDHAVQTATAQLSGVHE